MTEIVFGSLLLVFMVLALTALVIGARMAIMPSRPAVLTVNNSSHFDVKTGEKLLGALQDHDVLVPSACAGAGTCGLCRVKIEENGPSYLPVETARISKAEQREGVHLACQIVLRENMSVVVPQELVGATTYVCKVVGSKSLTPLIREIVLQLPDEIDENIVAGSFLQVTAPPFALSYQDIEVPPVYDETWAPLRKLNSQSDIAVTRAYSISNRPEDTVARRIVLNIRLALPPPSAKNAPPGVVSSWLFGLEAGDDVTASGPFGTFRAQDSKKEMVLIGGGVGMAPLRAIIHEQLAKADFDRAISFWFGASNTAEMLYQDELDALVEKHKNFRWTAALSDPQPGEKWDGATGFVHQVALDSYLKSHPSPEDCEYYLCGPPLMIRAVLQMLDELGVESGSIFNDDFGV